MISLHDRLRKGKVVVVDIETTGLVCGEEGKESGRIIEIAAIKYIKRHPVERFHTYVACPVPIPAEIFTLTGITDETLSCFVVGVTFPETARELLQEDIPDWLVAGDMAHKFIFQDRKTRARIQTYHLPLGIGLR